MASNCKSGASLDAPLESCSCGEEAVTVCCCRYPALPLLPLCPECSVKHFERERGEHQQLPVKAMQFVTSGNTYREAVLRIERYEDIKRKLQSSAQLTQHNQQLLTDATAQIISKVEKIKETSLSALQQTRQAVIFGKDKIVESMENHLFDIMPYFPSAEETELFRFELGLEAVEKALEGFGQVVGRKTEGDTGERGEKLATAKAKQKKKGHGCVRPGGRKNRLDMLRDYVLPPNKNFKCPQHKAVFSNAKALVTHLRAKHEKFELDMLPSEQE